MTATAILNPASPSCSRADVLLSLKRFINHLVTLRVARVERELRAHGHLVSLDADEFIPFHL